VWWSSASAVALADKKCSKCHLWSGGQANSAAKTSTVARYGLETALGESKPGGATIDARTSRRAHQRNSSERRIQGMMRAWFDDVWPALPCRTVAFSEHSTRSIQPSHCGRFKSVNCLPPGTSARLRGAAARVRCRWHASLATLILSTLPSTCRKMQLRRYAAGRVICHTCSASSSAR